MKTEECKNLGFGGWEKAFPNRPCYTANLGMEKMQCKEGNRDREEVWRFEFPSKRFV